MYPIIIICYNNHLYVDNMIKQLSKINKEYIKFISILNNKSNNLKTIEYLKNTNVNVINRKENNGPWIDRYRNVDIYDSMPDKFIITDPDLMLNENIPSNFIEILDTLSNKHNIYKIGFALDISDSHEFHDDIYFNGKTIHGWESGFWNNKVDDSEYELYLATIDTTFCLINKLNASSDVLDGIRIAGNFTCKHLPWYKIDPVLMIPDTYEMYSHTNGISTISSIKLNYIKDKYVIIPKNNQLIFIEKNHGDSNISFWSQQFTNWKNDTFNIFDELLDKNKIFIDMGAWIGTTAIYSSKLSKHVYAIEADTLSYQHMVANCKINSKNITCINKSVYNAGLNQSFYNVISDYNIDPLNISLIKVDIGGSEEYILQDLFDIFQIYKIPIYISFHYTLWTNKDLDRFTFLTNEQKNIIILYPFCSILFKHILYKDTQMLGRSAIDANYIAEATNTSDINEHLPTLARYGSECNHITEMGVRSARSSYAFAHALKNKKTNKLVQVDLYHDERLSVFMNDCIKENINTVFHHTSSLECPLEQTDLLFIDTWHVYGQLKRELERWNTYVGKYIIMHDTTVDEWAGETIRDRLDAKKQSEATGIPIHEITKGLWPAIREFLASHPEWIMRERYNNNNGLTILERV